MITTGHFVKGTLVTAGDDHIEVVNPSNGEVIGRTAEAGPALAREAVAAAVAAAPAWAATTLAERADYLTTWRDKLVGETDALVELTVDELGLVPSFARNTQVNRAPDYLVELAAMAEAVFTPRTVANSLVVREPAGVLAAITAWNFPLHQLVSKVAAGLIMGNTVVVKPSEIKPLAAWRATELLAEIGLPPGVVNVVSGRGATVGAALVAERDVDVISFTGSRDVGKTIMASAATTLTRCVLELGGKNGALVVPSADLDLALPAVIGSCFFNNGQVCGAQTRLIVARAQLAEIEQRVAAIVDAVVPGDARDPRTTLGPLVTPGQQQRVAGFIDLGVRTGLRLIAGGPGRPAGVPDGGFFMRPTVFSDVPPDHPLAQEEIFGPVLVIQAAEDVEQMITLANSTRYGLTSAVWAGEPDEALAVARRMRSGQVTVNGGAFNLHAPCGGYKESGNGREHGLEGLAEFTEVKAIQLPA